MATSVYHLDLTDARLEGATTALLPGDPGGCPGSPRRHRSSARASWRTSASTAAGSPTCTARRCSSSRRHRGPSASSPSTSSRSSACVRSCVWGRRARSSRISTSRRRRHDGRRASRRRLDALRARRVPRRRAPRARHAALDAGRDAGVTCHAGVSASCDTFYPARNATIRTRSTCRGASRRHRGVAPASRAQLRDGVVHRLTLCADGPARRLRGGRRRQPHPQREGHAGRLAGASATVLWSRWARLHGSWVGAPRRRHPHARSDRLRQGYGGPPKRSAKAKAGLLDDNRPRSRPGLDRLVADLERARTLHRTAGPPSHRRGSGRTGARASALVGHLVLVEIVEHPPATTVRPAPDTLTRSFRAAFRCTAL